ncbi:alpha/beta hydrolase [Fortiea contorta]|uniref:alpha/beta hydrolase n=1 Tax=Fortiea contorta TaxID=1892405 RepID=UPI001EE672D3|nr:alpha/beta hydrolase [Fortiea contorta]
MVKRGLGIVQLYFSSLLPITHYPLPITDYQLPITHYPLPITHYQLPITDYPLPIQYPGRIIVGKGI